MTEKRFQLIYNEYETSNGEIIKAEPYFIDRDEEYVDEDDFTIDGYLTMSDEQVVKLLNEQDNKIKEVETRNKRQCERLEEITDLMVERDWESLEKMVEDWEQAEELLQAEIGTYGDVE